ncbi:UDP-N-acetyl-D-mannosamine dehydrogenase, partial [Xanthomonas citri pv. citri]|nr:UDP-N-acetyl-D-mannosamine dehydrogenase [Xanthomonas citri pv. citri]
AARNIAPLLEGDELVILESTSPPQTTQLLGRVLTEARPDLTVDPQEAEQGQKKLIHLAYCPERILPGKAMEELVTNDPIIGAMTPEA